MAKYKVITEFVMNGILRKVDEIINLDSTQEKLTSIKANIVKVSDNEPVKDASVLGSVIPGVPLTPEQKEKLATENLAASIEAQRLAADQRTRDVAEGNGEPAVKVVADMLKEKLEKEEFEQPPVA